MMCAERPPTEPNQTELRELPANGRLLACPPSAFQSPGIIWYEMRGPFLS